MNRRRFLQISAAALGAPQGAQAQTVWRGTALGAEAEVSLTGPSGRSAAVLAQIPGLLDRVEATFSLYRPSELTRLNRDGRARPSRWMRQLCQISGDLHRLTEGAFDPSVQPLWQALAAGHAADRSAIGWHRLTIGPQILLGPGQALTFNGIAQGFATDLIRTHLAGHGFGPALVNIGEYAALGGPFRLGVADPAAGLLAQWQITEGALAASSPQGTLVGGQPHLQHPRGLPPLWSTVAVQARSATLADGLSTALVFLTRAQIARILSARPDVVRVALIDPAGNLQTL